MQSCAAAVVAWYLQISCRSLVVVADDDDDDDAEVGKESGP